MSNTQDAAGMNGEAVMRLVKEYGGVRDDIGRSRNGNNYAMNKGAVNRSAPHPAACTGARPACTTSTVASRRSRSKRKPDMTTDHKDLPPLPEPAQLVPSFRDTKGVEYSTPYFDTAQMHAYALADRAQRVAPAEVLEEAMRLAGAWVARGAAHWQCMGDDSEAAMDALPRLREKSTAARAELHAFLSQHLGAQRVEQAELVATVRGFSMGGSPIIDWVDWIDGPRVRPGAKLYTRPVGWHLGTVTVTTNEAGECVAVTRTDEDDRILSVIWERAATPPASAPGFSPMHLAPIDGTSVLLHIPTCGDRFAIGQFHSDGPDTISGHWGDDEGSFYVHKPVAFMALDNLARLLGPVAATTDAPTAQAAPARTATVTTPNSLLGAPGTKVDIEVLRWPEMGDAAQGEREVFEAWFRDGVGDWQEWLVRSTRYPKQYDDSQTDAMWEAWQARAAHSVPALTDIECPPDPETVDRALDGAVSNLFCACCSNERRTMRGGCANCGDPCL